MAAWGHHVQRRGRVYHLRVRLPADIRAWLDRREARRSRETGCPVVARQRAAQTYARLITALGEIRRLMSAENETGQSPDMRNRLIAVLEAALENAWAVIEQERRTGELRLETLERHHLNQQFEDMKQQQDVFASANFMLEGLKEAVEIAFEGEKVARRIGAIRKVRENAPLLRNACS